jgi:nitrite reductase/ring-hydroxylating ferredoxin subunit
VQAGRDLNQPREAVTHSVQEWLDLEKRPVPPSLRKKSFVDMGTEDLSIDRYLSRDWHDREVEKMWKKVWQVACRADDIPEVGDTFVYEVAHLSIIVVRAAADEIRAHVNACPHRGTQLRTTETSNVPEFRCQYHGMCWNLDGSFESAPCEWDMTHVDRSKFGLSPVHAEVWQGFVFVNMDPDAVPLAEYLGGIVEHHDDIARPPLGERYKAAHVAKVVDCNWKLPLDAFIEAYHLMATHPEIINFTCDSDTEYDIYPGEPHWSRQISPVGQPSSHAGPGIIDQDVIDGFLTQSTMPAKNTFVDTETGQLKAVEDVTAHEVLADLMRSTFMEKVGFDASQLTDCEVVDGIGYNIFPNLQPWFGISVPFIFRSRPYGDDPHKCVLDIMLLFPVPAGMDKPPSCPIHWLEPGDSWLEAPEIGEPLCIAMDQDEANWGPMMKGMRTSVKPGVTLVNYQESRIRHYNQTLDAYLAR